MPATGVICQIYTMTTTQQCCMTNWRRNVSYS